MKKKLCSKKGSTMVMLVVIIGIVSILGTALLGVTMVNYKIKRANTDIKQSFYLSESGLDKAYAVAYEYVAEAVRKANEDFLSEFTPENMEYWMVEEPSFIAVDKDDEGSDIYSYKDAVIQEAAKIKFENKYMSYISSEIAGEIEGVTESDSEKSLIVTVANEDNLEFVNKKMTLELESEYMKEGISKTTAVNLTLEVPKYNESYTVTTQKIPVNPFWTKVIVAKYLEIKDNCIFDGKVHVSNDATIDKSGATAQFTDELAVKGDIYIRDGSSAKVSDTSVTNIFMTGRNAELTTFPDSKLQVKDDLEIDNENQTVEINGSYYGFSDGSYSSHPDSSSGININESKNLNLKITENLYILGTSYVNVMNSSGKYYQTGESLSVKGNYMAYLQPLFSPDDTKLEGTNIKFTDYQYLRFADGFSGGGTMAPWDKGDYIRSYQSEYGGLKIPGGIIVNRAITLGSYVSNNELKVDNWAYDTYKSEFVKAEERYDKATDRLGYDAGTMKFSEQVKLSNVAADIEETDELGYYVYIQKGTGSKIFNERKYKGLIITNGDVVFGSNVESFEGSVVAGGTVTILGSSTFKYNKDIASKIIADNKLHTTVFDGSSKIDEVIRLTYTSDEDAGGNTDFSNLLKFNNWKIK